MTISARHTHHNAGESVTESATPAPRTKQRRTAALVTGDDALWPTVGAAIAKDVVLQQIDSIDQLLTSIEPGHAGVVVWDARGETDRAAQLGRVQQHSARIAVMVLDDPATGAQWQRLIEQNQVVCLIPIPFTPESFNEGLSRAFDETQTRVALLGAQNLQAPAEVPAAAKRFPLPVIVGAGLAAVALAAGLFLFSRNSAPPQGAVPVSATATTAGRAAVPVHHSSGVDQIDTLLEKATTAMLDRRYIEPPDNSALSFYRNVLAYDAHNEEAKQGLDRLAELLLSKAQSALDQRRFEPALQALEIARSINRDDPRAQALDARVSKMRTELGASLIQAAVNAGNYERASTLIEEATHAKSLPPAQLAQLREDLRRRHDDADVDRLMKTAQAREQQDKLIDPPNDSAARYFTLAKKAGADSPVLAAAIHDFGQRLTQAAHTAIDQHRFGDADRLLNEAKQRDVPAAAIAELQHQIAGARGQATREKSDQQHLVDLANERLAQGNLLEPDHDSAIFYLNSLKTADPQNPALAELSRSVQAQIVARASSLLGQGRVPEAQAAVRLASNLGSSAELNAVSEKISQAGQAAAADMPLKLVKPIRPQYPTDAAMKGTEGWVELGFTVNPNGRTTAIHVIDSSPKRVFDRAAVDAMGSARYEPAPKDAPQVPRDARLRLTFKLNN